jgi:hypothetical protein
MANFTFEQMLNSLDCNAVQTIIPLGSLRNDPKVWTKVADHIASCGRCQEVEKLCDPNTPLSEACQKAQGQIEAYTDRTLPKEQSPAFIHHLKNCPLCFNMVNTIELAALLAGRLRRTVAPTSD